MEGAWSELELWIVSMAGAASEDDDAVAMVSVSLITSR